MEMLLIMTYTGFCWAVFKIFKIPVNKWSIPTAILGGVAMIAFILLVMNYNHPYSTLAREYFVTTQIVPNVEGQVIAVPVEANTPLKAGDVLFQIDPAPYQYDVDRLEAALADASAGAAQLEQRLVGAGAGTAGSKRAQEEARAAVAQFQAQLELARTQEARYRELVGKGLVAQVDYDRAKRQLETTQAQLAQAQAAVRQSEEQSKQAAAQEQEARLAVEAESGGMNPQVRQIMAQLGTARWNLEQTTVRAPTDGIVTQLTLRPGFRAVSFPMRPAMTFIHTGPNDRALVGAFWQNSLQRIVAGDEAEVIYKGVPGHVFKGKVERILPVLSQGQISSSGVLQSVEAVSAPGKVPVVITLDEDLSKYHLPAGVVGSAAIYTKHVHHVALLRKILLRMVSWQNFIFGELH